MTQAAKRILRRALNTIGFEVRRASSGQIQDAGTVGKCVELIGPSGVGKTTTITGCSTAVRMRWLYRPQLGNIEIARAGSPIDARIQQQLFSKKLEADERLLERPYRETKYFSFFSYLARILAEDLLIRSGDLSAGVLLDEGICQVFKVELIGLPDPLFARIMKDRSLVLLTSRDPVTVVNQIRKRSLLAGRTRGDYSGKTDAELAELVSTYTAQSRQLAARAEAFGVAVLRLTVEDGTVASSARLAQFLEELARKPGIEPVPASCRGMNEAGKYQE